ncbi:hypothetical protein [Arthrobacter crystallopoietes]|uniref:hypothetical protein n=1 Tax=Crystallibacter crystallopoietes TaxID=37928 RepID=UPI001ABE9180|nr:hypothetical protein [Arthrobacter crystallopoietes]QTG82079.1 hypothetical protein J5251_05740 [Arthrobacter crystallopoietes]
MALNWGRDMARSGADEQSFAGGFDDFGGDGGELVDVADASDLSEELLDEPEVAYRVGYGTCRIRPAESMRSAVELISDDFVLLDFEDLQRQGVTFLRAKAVRRLLTCSQVVLRGL